MVTIPTNTRDQVIEKGEKAGRNVKGLLVKPVRNQLEILARLCDEGRLTIRLDNVYPLANAAEAHIRMENKLHTGKIILKTG